MPFDPISYDLASKKIPPVLKDLDMNGRIIKNLGEPVDPNDAARKVYVDVAAIGLGINYFLLDAADSSVPAYKSMQLDVPVLAEAYVETTQSTAGDYEIASWIAPSDGIPLKLGVYEFHCQAEKISGNLNVRLFYRLYERQSDGTEVLIAESMVSDRIDSRRDIIISLILANDYTLTSGSRLVVKLYARYENSGASTTVRVYYQGDVRSRLALPTTKEILDTIYAAKLHASQHALGGEDEISVDASQITSGILDVARIPDLTRSKITDFFSSPFWANIPDKPFANVGSEFQVVGNELQVSGIDASKVTSGVFDVARIPDLPRSKISDFFATPFWDNIPDKPSTFPSALSQLTIDVDKDWGGKRILKLGGLWVDTTGSFPNTQGGFIAWNYPRGVGATVFFNHHGTGNTEYIFYSTTDWSNFTELLRITNSNAQFNVHILPKTDNTYDLGSSSLRWANLYAVNVYTGDLNFEEKVCEVCGQPFLKDDELVLKVKEVDDYTRTVPVHLKCSQAYKELDERLKLLEEKVGGD